MRFPASLMLAGMFNLRGWRSSGGDARPLRSDGFETRRYGDGYNKNPRYLPHITFYHAPAHCERFASTYAMYTSVVFLAASGLA